MRESSACAPCSSFSRALQWYSSVLCTLWYMLDFLISLFDKRVFRNEAALPGLCWRYFSRANGDTHGRQ